MRLTNFVILSLIFFSAYSQQWSYNTIKDEFGDDTNKKEYQIKLIGTFNNSAQTGSKAILFLSYTPGHNDYNDSYGSLTFEVYEYNNNPADFNRRFYEMEVALKNSNGDVHRSLILTNEFSSDNSFTMTQYFDPITKISERTIKKDKGDYYEVTKPTYDIDFKLIEDLIYGKGKNKLNIYSSSSEYFFELNSLGLTHSEDFNKLISNAKEKEERRKLKEQKEKEDAVNKEEKISSILKNIKSDLDEISLKNIKKFLRAIEDSDFELINNAELFLYKAQNNYDIRLNKSMFEKRGYVSIDFISADGTSIDLKKYSEYGSSAYYEYDSLTFLKLNEESDFKTSYLNQTSQILNDLNNKVQNLFSDKYGGAFFKTKIKSGFEFDVFYYNVKTIKDLKIKLKENQVDFTIKYTNGHESNFKIDQYDFYGKKVNLKKFVKENKIEFDKEYSLLN